MAYIYKIINDINQKVYIGKTEFSIEKRFKEHCHDAFKERCEKRPLYAAMRKYGIEHFHIEEIEECDNPEEREKFWIEQYHSFKYGYNATMGGDGKKYLDYDLILKTFNTTKNCAETARLLKISADTVREVVKKNGLQPNNGIANRKPVAKIDLKTGKILAIYESAVLAEQENNINNHINAVCKGNRKSAGGYGWKYLSELEK